MKITPHFTAIITFLPEEESSQTTPISSGFRCDIKFPFDLEVYTAVLNFINSELIFPGDTATADVAVLKIDHITGKIFDGLDFELYTSQQHIGHGVVTKLIINEDGL